jgi:NAD(P)-dependent dehydrogenase (short-subunit alcohol dehydrogenase family)
MPGSIVNLSSQASAAALRDHSIYCASKGAVDSLTRVMAMELGPHQVSFSFFYTPMNEYTDWFSLDPSQ